MDASGIDRAMLINYVAPDVIGFTSGVNQFVADYVKEDPKRLLSCGSVHPRQTTNVMADVEQILRLGIQMIKIHPPHQLLFPNEYLTGAKELEIIYRVGDLRDSGVGIVNRNSGECAESTRVFANNPIRPSSSSSPRLAIGEPTTTSSDCV